MSTVSGAYGVGDPPVPIPNTEVKTHCGNNTWTTRSWQDSTVPDLLAKLTPPARSAGGVRTLKQVEVGGGDEPKELIYSETGC